MKLIIDFEKKTIGIEEKVNIGELVNRLQKILPETWFDFTIDTNVTFELSSPPIIIEKSVYPWDPYQPYITYNSTSIQCSDNVELISYYDTIEKGTYFIEIK